MKPVRYRNGFANQGGMDARFLADSSDVPFLKKRHRQPDGSTVVAHKRGEFLEVTREGQALDGFYSLGKIDGVQRVVGSATARGRFRNLGVFADGGALAGVTAILNYGRGLGFDQSATLVGTAFDFDSKPCNIFEVTIHRTRDGRDFTPFYSYLAFAPFDNSTFFSYLFGEVYGGANSPTGERKAFNNHAFMRLNQVGQHVIAFMRDDGTTQTLGSTVFLPNQLASAAKVNRMAPGVYSMMTKYLRPTYLGSSVVVGDCPGLAFSFSFDAGATWTAAASAELFQEFFDTVPTLPESGYATRFNQAVNAAALNIGQRSANIAIAYALVPYADNPTTDYVIFGKVKLGIIDAAARTLLGTLTLFDGALAEAVAFWEGGALGVKDGMAFVTKPVGSGGVAGLPDEPARMFFTPDGVSVVEMGTFPQPNYRTGLVSALSPTQLVCPMYDGEHSLYESRDRGATWTKRAVLTSAGPVPVNDPENRLLQDFAALTFLRLNGVPANSTPGTPWASDSRIAAPIL
ncbi:hypothetical protein [Variovorax sp. DXTD-1]|uniref:hypothetical protein n=1 Tax=Variovorax sp. DXTD-1 TaxID=2495592 RepID=UPI000F8934A6|nr:hypothetical protein [Variovorax sp. DXTD-1]RST54103.1 hypothetical protein EJI00_02965 [Variovorax sp. DXTD-1]